MKRGRTTRCLKSDLLIRELIIITGRVRPEVWSWKIFPDFGMSGQKKTEGKVLYCDAEVNSCDKAACVNWLDIVPGVVYSIGTTGEKPDAGKLLELANLVFSPTQGEA